MQNAQLLEYIPLLILALIILTLYSQIKIWSGFAKKAQEFYRKQLDRNGKFNGKSFLKNLQKLNSTSQPQKTFNPFSITNNISENAANKEKVLKELKLIKRVKKKKEIMPGVLDLETVHFDNTLHQYRATVEGNVKNFKILQLTRYS